MHENLFMTKLWKRSYHLEAIVNHRGELLAYRTQDGSIKTSSPESNVCLRDVRSRQRCKQLRVDWYVAKYWKRVSKHSTDEQNIKRWKENEKKHSQTLDTQWESQHLPKALEFWSLSLKGHNQ